MYALFAYIGGQWGIAGIDPHEECAVLFIDQVDAEFGNGTAFVAKLPDKEDHTPIADAAEHTSQMSQMADLLKALETNNVNLDDALQKLTEKFDK